MARKDENAKAKVRAAERRKVAFEYYKIGMGYRAIGDRLGISHVQAFRDVKAVLKEIRESTQESAEEMKQAESERINAYRLTLANQAAKGNVAAIRELRKLSESYRKLHGLDAPTKIAPTNPEGDKPYDPEDLTLDERFERIQILKQHLESLRD